MARRSDKSEGYRARRLAARRSRRWGAYQNLVLYALAAVVAFGAVLGVSVYGISQADVLIFGVVASVVAALGAVLGGFVDHRIGSKPVIVVSLVAIVTVTLTLMVLSGSVAFWACGLLLAL